MTADRRRACFWCGIRTLNPDRVCIDCVDDIALEGGEWVIGPRRVLVWEPRKDLAS